MKIPLIGLMTLALIACGGGGGGGAGDLLDVDVSRSSGGSSGSGSSTSSGSGSNNTGGNCNYSWSEVLDKGFGCHSDVGSGSAGSTSGGQTPPSGSLSVRINRVAEYEPNGSAANANIVEFPAVTGDTLQGIEIAGSVATSSDESDFFAFTPDRSGSYAVYLCDGVCTEQPTDAKVALRVLDQFGQPLAENPLYEESSKILTAHFDEGLVYYVQLLGFDTEGTYPYKLVIIE